MTSTSTKDLQSGFSPYISCYFQLEGLDKGMGAVQARMNTQLGDRCEI